MREEGYRKIFLEIKRKLKSFRTRKILSSFFFFLFLIISFSSAFVIVIIFLDNIVYLVKVNRVIIRISFLLVPIVFLFFFVKGTRKFLWLGSIVKYLENSYPVFKGRLFAAFECSPQDPYFSKELIYANIKDVKETLDSIPIVQIVATKHIKSLRVLYLLLISIFFLFALSPFRFFTSFARVLFEKDVFLPVFVVQPGSGYVEKGGDFSVSLQSIIGRVSKPVIVVEDKKIFLHKGSENFFTASIENVKKPFTYHIEFSDTFSPDYIVEVVEHPRIENVTLTLHYPPYTNEKSYKTVDFDIYALKGTRVEISGKCTQSVRDAKLKFDDSTEVNLRIDEYTFNGNFDVDTTMTFTIDLLSKRGLRNMEKSLFHVFSFQDEYPTIEIVKPGEDIELPQEFALDLVFEVSDDYGISKVLLIWEKDEEENSILVLSKPKEKSMLCNHRWDLINLPIFPGDTLKYYGRVYDNDIISGPKMRRTRTYIIRFPTAEEIYREIASGGERAQESFETESSELEDLKEGLQELEKSLKESKSLSWEEKKKAEEIIRKEKELIENIEKTREEMEDLAKRINESFLSNPEIREKLSEIERLMKELETERIKKSIEELKKALNKMDRREMLRVLENMIFSQEEIKKALERTIEILKRIGQEERFEKIVEKAQELEDEQRRINEQMKGIEGDKLKDLQSAEKEMEDELHSLRDAMDALAKELGRSDSIAGEALENATLLASDIIPQLKETQKAMDQGQERQSLTFGQEAAKSFSKMSNMLSAGLSSMLTQRKKDIEKRINAIIGDIVFLSEESEKIMEHIRDEKEDYEILPVEDGIRDGILKTHVEIEELRSKIPFVPPEVDEELQRAIASIEASAKSLLKSNPSISIHYARRTMKSLNLAALLLIEIKENLPGGGSGSMAQLLQQLQSISGGQMQVNQGTQMLFPLDASAGSTPYELKRELQRLSELQGSLAERLKRIEEGLGERDGDILGDLGKITDEMEEVARDLMEYNVDRELIEREERILSRMLDAQRSVHKREFSKKRVAERPGKDERRDPPSLPEDLGETESIRKDLLRELGEKYPQEYRDLIRAYFEKLLREENIMEQ